MVPPFYYGMINGETGHYQYWCQNYTPLSKKDDISIASWVREPDVRQLLHTPLSVEAHDQLMELQNLIQTQWSGMTIDTWTGTGQNRKYSSIKMYKTICARAEPNKLFTKIWKTANRLRHKIFFWLLLHDRVNTRNLLNRKNMFLESYDCVFCNEHSEETLRHLF